MPDSPASIDGDDTASVSDVSDAADASEAPENEDRNLVGDVTRWADDLQRRNPVLGFVHGVIKKYGDDRGGQQAALLTYYGFFSLFPLLMVAFTILAYVLDGNPDLQESIADTVTERLPIPGLDVNQISGSGVALVVGTLLALWAGLGATQVAQDAMNLVWDTPRVDHPSFLIKKLRGLATLVVVAAGIVAATAAGSVASLVDSGSRLVGLVAALIVNVAVVGGLFQVLTTEKLSARAVLPGAAVVGVGWTVLQSIATWYTARLVDNANKTYGTFAVVIGLLSWIYLQSQVFMYGAEVSTVSERGLWPRAIDRDRPTEADERVAEAKARRFKLK